MNREMMIIPPVFKRSIHTHLRFLVVIVLLTVLGIIVYTGVEMRDEALLDAERNALSIIHHEGLSLERFVEGTRSMLVTLAEVPEVRALNTDVCNRIFRSILEKNPAYNSLQAATSDGFLFASAKPL